MELQKAKQETFTISQIKYIKEYCKFIDIGSEVSCYRLNFKQVIKIFDVNPNIDPNKKLFLPDNIYGSNTFVFIDAIQIYCNKIYSYTMKYVEGARLGKSSSIKLFYELSFSMLYDYMTTLVNDCKKLANQGIQAFDCFENNIILSNTGFKQIDCVDFTQQDKDPTLIEQENIKLMCQTIWDSLIAPQLSTFLANNNLNFNEFKESPTQFIEELKIISQKHSDTEIITLEDTRKLARKKR